MEGKCCIDIKDFVEKMKAESGVNVYNRKIKELVGIFILKQQTNPYNLFSQGKRAI